MKPRHLWFAVLLACSASAMAQLNDTDDSTQAKCKQYLQIPLPAEAATVPAPKQWPDCNSYKLYSGIGTKVDYTAARQCAWSERLAIQAHLEPRYTVASVVGGAQMLMLLYANGEGVEQNKAMAHRFACESDLGKVADENIDKLSTSPHLTSKKMTFCDEAMTTFDINFCAAYRSEIAAQKRQDELESLMQSWPSKDREAFSLLKKASEDYVEAHGRGEVYQGGTIRNVRTDGVEEHQRDKFLEALKSFEAGHLPKGTHSDFQKADADLNSTYREVLALAAAQNFSADDGLIQPDGIRDSERAWIKYRDAWVAFAKSHYPDTTPDPWMTLLTANRVWSLRWTMCEVGWNDPACKSR